MSEMENSQMTAEAQPLGFWEKFVGGGFGLAKTYWLGGVVPSACTGVVMRMVSTDTARYWIGAALVIYQLVLIRALWNAGKRYPGARVWPVLAFLIMLSAISRNIGFVLAIGKH